MASEPLFVGAWCPKGTTRYLAGADLTAAQGKAVKISAAGTLGNPSTVIVVTATTDDAIGVIAAGGASGAEVAVWQFGNELGTVPFRAGAAVASGDRLKFNSSGLWIPTTATTDKCHGRAQIAASGSGMLFEALAHPASVLALA